jgi:hypothetical protein
VTDLSGGPTLRSELRRGVNAFNLGVGFVTALAIGAGVLVLTSRGLLPLLLGRGPWPQSLLAAFVSFLAITGFHAGMHAYFGWRLQRGIRAASEGREADARRLLRVLDWRGMEHYDEHGVARKSLAICRDGERRVKAVAATPG